MTRLRTLKHTLRYAGPVLGTSVRRLLDLALLAISVAGLATTDVGSARADFGAVTVRESTPELLPAPAIDPSNYPSNSPANDAGDRPHGMRDRQRPVGQRAGKIPRVGANRKRGILGPVIDDRAFYDAELDREMKSLHSDSLKKAGGDGFQTIT